jgi:hypothetical protein
MLKKNNLPKYEKILKNYIEIENKIKNITTIESAIKYQNKNEFYGTVEVNGCPVNAFTGKDIDIKWIRYENYKNLDYIYCWIQNGKCKKISFDIYSSYYDFDFIENTTILSRKEYNKKINEITGGIKNVKRNLSR